MPALPESTQSTNVHPGHIPVKKDDAPGSIPVLNLLYNPQSAGRGPAPTNRGYGILTWDNPNNPTPEPLDDTASPLDSAAPHPDSAAPPSPGTASPIETTGHEDLDAQLAQPVLKADTGIDTAQIWISAFLALVFTAIVFSPVLSAPVLDSERPLLTADAPGLKTLPMLTLVAAQSLGVGDTGHHAVNLLLHLANAFLFYFLLRRLLPNAMPIIIMAGAMLFAGHPLTTHAVNTLAGRPYLMAALFSFGSLLAYTHAWRRTAEDDPTQLNPWPLGLSLLLFVLALSSHAVALFVPAVIVVMDRVLHGRENPAPRAAVRFLYWGLLLTAILLARAAGQPVPLFAPDSLPIIDHLRLLVCPAGLSAVRQTAAPGIILYAALAAYFAAVSLSAALRSPIAVAIAWVALCVALTPAGAGENAGYLTVAGFVLLWPLILINTRPPVRTLVGLCVALLVIGMGASAYKRCLAWQDPIALWSATAAAAPASPMPNAMLGQTLTRQAAMVADPKLAADAYAQAEISLRDAIQKGANDPATAYALAQAVDGQGPADEALPLHMDVLARDPAHRPAMVRAADILMDRYARNRNHNDFAQGVALYRKAENIEPLDGPPLANYAAALVELGDYEAAKQAAARLPEQFAPIKKQADDMLQRLKALEQQSTTIAAKNPNDPALIKIKAQALVLRNQALQASYLLDTYKRDNGLDFGSWLLLGFARAKMGAAAAFVAENPAPPTPPAGVAGPWLELAKACVGANLWDAARAYIESEPARAEAPMPALALADIAVKAKSPRAKELLQQAAEQYPAEPGPWLYLADIAIAAKDDAEAARCLAEAESRGAPSTEITARKQK